MVKDADVLATAYTTAAKKIQARKFPGLSIPRFVPK
jgi:hypothetical protein